MLAGKPVPVEKTKVFGCSTKWSDKRDSAKQAFEQWAQEPVDLEHRRSLDDVKTLLTNDS